MLLGKRSFGFRSPSDRYCQSFLSTEHIFDLGLKTLGLPNMNFYLKETFRNGSLISRTLIQKWTECKFESKTALSEAGRYFLKWVRPFLDGYIIRTAGTTSRGLFSACTVTQWKIKMQTIQYRRTRIWEMKKINIQKPLPRIRSVKYFKREILGKTV